MTLNQQPFVGSFDRTEKMPMKHWGRNKTTPEMRAWAVALHYERPELSRAEIARKVNREFDVRVHRDSVGQWIKKAEKDA